MSEMGVLARASILARDRIPGMAGFDGLLPSAVFWWNCLPVLKGLEYFCCRPPRIGLNMAGQVHLSKASVCQSKQKVVAPPTPAESSPTLIEQHVAGREFTTKLFLRPSSVADANGLPIAIPLKDISHVALDIGRHGCTQLGVFYRYGVPD